MDKEVKDLSDFVFFLRFQLNLCHLRGFASLSFTKSDRKGMSF